MPDRLIACKMKNQFYSSKLVEVLNGVVETLGVEPPTIPPFIWTRDLTRRYDKALTFLKNVFHNKLQRKPLNMITENFIVWLMRLNGLSPKPL
jgi:hypothetical protein